MNIAEHSHRSKYRATVEILGPSDEDGYDTLVIKAHGKGADAISALADSISEILAMDEDADTGAEAEEIARREDAARKILIDLLPPSDAIPRSVLARKIIVEMAAAGLLEPRTP